MSAPHVDQVDERGDDQRTERRLGEVFEQTGEEQQRHDRHDGGNEPRELRARAG